MRYSGGPSALPNGMRLPVGPGVLLPNPPPTTKQQAVYPQVVPPGMMFYPPAAAAHHQQMIHTMTPPTYIPGGIPQPAMVPAAYQGYALGAPTAAVMRGGTDPSHVQQLLLQMQHGNVPSAGSVQDGSSPPLLSLAPVSPEEKKKLRIALDPAATSITMEDNKAKRSKLSSLTGGNPSEHQAAEESAESRSHGDNRTSSIDGLSDGVTPVKILYSSQQNGLIWPSNLKVRESGNGVAPRPAIARKQIGVKSEATRWTPEEDDKLRLAVAKFNARNWKEIAKLVPGRDFTQCSQRWKKVLDPTVTKGQWSKEEDDLLISVVNQGQYKNWGHVAKLIPGRSAKQCRERYNGHLDPSLTKGNWTVEEDARLLEKLSEIGPRWSAIARCMPGRTDNQVKARVRTLLRERKQRETSSYGTSGDGDASPRSENSEESSAEE